MSEDKLAHFPPVQQREPKHNERNSPSWFEYPVKAHPHHTDYAGVVWHGAYIAWMEEARVEYLSAIGIEYTDLVNSGCNLPVVDLSVRYHKPMYMGMTAVVKSRMQSMEGVKLVWEYEIADPQSHEVFVTGQVTLVPVDAEKGKILRRLPPVLKNAIAKL
ncbi:thioesterase family protein [Geitlerinema sp. PCC 9228]|jgi:acyl-CoA thioester hydrolase|uniref:acyl-CoA thioesterase n=1 Tax=Geitlerinema sp. PCC 9228 TaxID=111611 RepID=UPI0008F9C5A9|nr:thioesterase family protein [Geitlerinema sp. PCC 9228]